MKETNKKFKFLAVSVQGQDLNVHVKVMLISANGERLAAQREDELKCHFSLT